MWFYIILFSFCVLVLVINNIIKQSHRVLFEIVTLIILSIVSGTRYYLGGSDYYVYKTVFDNIPTLIDFFEFFFNLHDYYTTFGFETGYLFYNSLVKSLGFNYFGFTLLNSIIFYFSFYIGVKKYAFSFNFVIIVFLYKLFFYNTFISMRQSVALAIFFIALKYLEENNLLKYFVSCFIAVLFHNSALILFLVYFINKFRLTKKRLILLNVIFIPTIFVSIFNLPIMRLFDFMVNLFDNPVAVDKITSLTTGVSLSSISMIHTLEYFFIMFLVIIYYKKVMEIDEHSEFIIKLFLLLLPIFTLFRGYEILTRVKDYFIFTYPMVLQYLAFMDNKKRNFIIQFVTVSICMFGFLRFIILFDNGAMMPYESFLFKDISIFENL